MSETPVSPALGQVSPDGQSVWNGTGWAPNPQFSQPKKKHTVRNVFLGIVAAFVLLIAGCTALIGGAANEIDKSIKENDARPGGADNPITLTEGKAFDVRGFAYATGWKVKKSTLDWVEVEGLKVTNNRKSKDLLWAEIKFWKGTEVLASVTCTTGDIAPGTTVSPDCSSTDAFPTGYEKITIQDSL